MVGERIRQARIEKGLSQQQLAGKELCRSFICRIERGKVRPSGRTLRLLAARLEKPVEFFTADAEGDRLEADVGRLLRRSEAALAAGAVAAALEPARQAADLGGRLGRPEAAVPARLLLVKVSEKAGRYAEALALGEELLQDYPTLPTPALLAEVCLHMGNSHLALEHYPLARRWFDRVLRVTAERRSLVDMEARAQIGLSAALFSLGEPAGAEAALRRALALCDQGAGPDCAGLARLNLGWIRYRQGDLPAGLAETAAARTVLESLDHPAAVYTWHNLAIMQAGQNQWDETIELLQACLQVYAQRGEVRFQAEALTELARCLSVHRFLREALEVCSQAMALLEQADDPLLRARLYRQMAMVHGAGGDVQRAHDLGLVGLELFRHLGAREELAETQTFLRDLSGL